jgi:membrane protease YdiL (CAAX protease family)
VSEPEPLPSLGIALGLVLIAGPFLVLALRRAVRRLAAVERPRFVWGSGEAAVIVLLPFVCPGLVGLALGPCARAPGAEVTPATAQEPNVLLAMLATQLVLGSAGALAVALASRRDDGLASLGLRRAPPSEAFPSIFLVYLPGFFVVMGLGLAWAHVCRVFGWEEQQEVLRQIVGLEHRELVAALLLAILVGPFVEELLFRGFLLGFMGQVVGERWALVCVSALFALMHGLAGLPVIFLLSLFLGWLLQRTRSLWVSWSAHALFNALMLAVSLSIGDKGIP